MNTSKLDQDNLKLKKKKKCFYIQEKRPSAEMFTERVWDEW